MQAPVRSCAVLLGLVVSSGCYHATIETGAPASTEVISKSFASGWIGGLVPPSTVSTAAKCSSGVAKVETQLSIGNQLVSFLTLGIYTPMSIKVTCAASRVGSSGQGAADLTVKEGANDTDVHAALAEAAELAAQRQRAVLVEIRKQ